MCAAETPLSPEEWRTFRAALVAGEAGGYPAAGDLCAGSRTPENEQQLEQQSEQLFKEYQRGGSWAHPTSTPEPGGLLCAMPLQAILMHRLQFAPAGECRWTDTLEALLRAELPAEDEEPASTSERRALLARWRASPALTFRLATRMCNEALERMRRGIAGPRELELWSMQVAALEVRNHVCLVLSTKRRGDQLTASAVTLSRLKASVVDRSLARRILYGEREGGVPTRAEAEVQAGSEAAAEAVVEAEVDRFLAAFGGQAAVYWGGPDALGEPALCVHARADLPGAVELSEGTRVYRGGARAAVEAVLAGEAHALEFRWFVGRQDALSTERGEWRSLACARPLLLKRSQALPKPFWHEVLELCGGECAELSRLVARENEGSTNRGFSP